MPLYLKLLGTALGVELHVIVPIILVLLGVALVTALLQAVLQLEDTALSLLPKTVTMVAMAILGGFGALMQFEALAVMWIHHAAILVRQSWS